jgi:multidrug efflux system membrane fusion protein
MQQMHSGKPLEVDAFDRTQQTLLAKGRLITLDNQIDTVTGTVKLRAQFDNSKGMLFPNEFVNTRLLVKTVDNQLLVPSSAIQHNGNTDFVYLIQGLTPASPGAHPGGAQGGGHHGNGGSAGGNGNGGHGAGSANSNGAASGNGGSAASGARGANGPTGKAVMKTVKSGISDAGNTAITGLNAGDMVANSSFQKLVNGSPVTQSSVVIPASSEETSEGAP